MKPFRKQNGAFTVVELLVAGAVACLLGAGLAIYTSSAIRMVARNLATNHSHESARGSMEKLFSDVHNSASRFQLMTFDGVNFTDVAATVSSDKDAYTQQYASNRANGVRFMRLGAGPCKLTGAGSGTISTSVTSLDTVLYFDLGTSTYTPVVGDKLQIPLISHEFDITAASATGTGNVWKITLNSAIGFSLITVPGTTTSGVTWPDPATPTNPVVTVGYFYERVGYAVWDNKLWFHPNLPTPPYPKAFDPTEKGLKVVRKNITSPKPFSLLFPTSTSTLTDASSLRVSLESYDTSYSARLFQNATTTLQVIIPSRNQPPILGGN